MKKWYPVGPYGTTISLLVLLHVPSTGIEMSFERDPKPRDEWDVTVYTVGGDDMMLS